MRVKCKFCSNFEGGFCSAKKSGGKKAGVKSNSNRTCDKYVINPVALAEEADKEYERRSIPIYAPTWRYFSSNKELEEKDERKGAKFVLLNPERVKRDG